MTGKEIGERAADVAQQIESIIKDEQNNVVIVAACAILASTLRQEELAPLPECLEQLCDDLDMVQECFTDGGVISFEDVSVQ